MNRLCKFPSDQKWKLLYRATRDGFSGENFLSKCDGIANTLTIIKSEHGNIFGGYVEKAWDSTIDYVLHNDPETKAFIFSLVNKENNPFTAECDLDCVEISCRSRYWLTFGNTDICIASDSNLNRKSFSDFGISYEHIDYRARETRSESILAGSYHFQTVEIEVFVAAE